MDRGYTHGLPLFLEAEGLPAGYYRNRRGQGATAVDHRPGYYHAGSYRVERNRCGRGGETARRVKEDPNFGTVGGLPRAVQVSVEAGTASICYASPSKLRRRGLCYPPVKDIVLASTGPSAAARAHRTGRIDDGRIDGGHRCGQRRPTSTACSRGVRGLDPALFFVLGIRLAFTPCVLPQWCSRRHGGGGRQGHPRRGLLLSGFRRADGGGLCGHGRAGRAGEHSGLQAWMQNRGPCCRSPPCSSCWHWPCSAYELQLPAFLRDRPREQDGREDLSRARRRWARCPPCWSAPA